MIAWCSRCKCNPSHCICEIEKSEERLKKIIEEEANHFYKEIEKRGVKHDSGKPRISLIPSEFIEGVATVFNFGAMKYGDFNYRKGIQHSRCLDACLRHVLAILRGEELDKESGLPHVYHAACSLGMFDYMRIHHPELNDIHELVKDTNK